MLIKRIGSIHHRSCFFQQSNVGKSARSKTTTVSSTDLTQEISKDRGEVLLMSGGIESSTLLHHLHQSQSHQIFPLFVNYGQRGHSKELEASHYFCNSLSLKLACVDLQTVGEFFRSQQKHKRHIPIPHRNLMILSISLGYCSQIITESSPLLNGINLNLGLNREDLNKPAYQSGTLEFVRAFDNLAHILDPKVKITTPLVEYSKADIIHLARDLNVDLSKTYSCMIGGETHCGHCMQCKSRKEAFSQAGIHEPEGFYRS